MVTPVPFTSFDDRQRKGNDERLAGVIHRHQRAGHKGGGGGHVEDAAGAALHHARQNQLGQAYRRHEVDLEQAALVLPRGLAERAMNAEAGVVDQDVDGASVHCTDDFVRGGLLREIGGHDAGVDGVPGDQVCRKFLQQCGAACD